MRIYKYILCILLISVFRLTIILARSVYENGPYVEREESAPVLSGFSKKKLLKEEMAPAHEENEDIAKVLDAPNNAVYEAPRFHQYDPAEFYVHPGQRIITRNSENSPYEVNKREYYPDMKTGRDSSVEVVLDPKARKAVALVDNQGQAENYEMQNWKNGRDDSYSYDNLNNNEPYTQGGNQDQIVNLVYPLRAPDRGAIRTPDAMSDNNFESNPAMATNNKNLRNTVDSDSGGQPVYKTPVSDPEKSDVISMKIKRHAKMDKKEIKESHNKEMDDEKEDSIKGSYGEDQPEMLNTSKESLLNNDKSTFNNKRSIPNWSSDQITALKDSLALFQENSAEYDNLKGILSDMGLLEETPVKRDTENKDDQLNTEDENLSDSNIAIKKNDRKWDTSGEDTAVENVGKRDLKKNNAEEDEEDDEESEEDHVVKRKINNDSQKKRSSDINKNKEKNVEKNDDDANSLKDRRKRDSVDNSNSPDIMKGLEKSGELTVSGNKSPLASEEKVDPKEKSAITEKDQKRKRDTDIDTDENNEDYEKRIESQIQAKIDAIKEKVKREIYYQKQQHAEKHLRKKRNTLLDIDEKHIDPGTESYDVSEPHIRKRRDAETQANKNSNVIVKKKSEEVSKQETLSNFTTKNENLDSKNNIGKEDNNNVEDDDLIYKKKRDLETVMNANMSTGNSIQSDKLIRKKRANGVLPENKMVYRPFQAEQEEDEQEENGEFDNAYDQINIEKRQAYEPDYQYFERKEEGSPEYEAPEKALNYMGGLYPEQRYRRSQASAYVADLNSDNYDQPIPMFKRSYQARHYPRTRFKRQKRDNENTPLFSRGVMTNRKAAMKSRDADDREKRNNDRNNKKNSEEDNSGNNENDFFGALPQNYQEGELTRYKRVKRDEDAKKSIEVV